jgi:hypothetical protein
VQGGLGVSHRHVLDRDPLSLPGHRHVLLSRCLPRRPCYLHPQTQNLPRVLKLPSTAMHQVASRSMRDDPGLNHRFEHPFVGWDASFRRQFEHPVSAQRCRPAASAR